jgi:NAD(P)-dependent dehydrogenase (short-subunit alcohol dehydrogenase family)
VPTLADMEKFEGLTAVITGAGTGMGRELARQLAAEGCHVAMCDISEEAMAQTKSLCETESPAGTRITTFLADVSNEDQIIAFRDAVASEHAVNHIELLFNNAGIGGGGSFVADDRTDWDRTFGICWGGVYNCTRAFMPMLLAAQAGHVINTSSVNGFWASLGPDTAHTAYSAAKFAVKGFTEALQTDFRLNAPHLKASVVMPGHIGTSIALNSGKILGRDPKELTADQVAQLRERLARRGMDLTGASDDDIRLGIQAQAESFRDNAPMTAAAASKVILDGVRCGEWRILVGEDAHTLDQMVRETPQDAYEPAFMDRVRARGAFGFVPASED